MEGRVVIRVGRNNVHITLGRGDGGVLGKVTEGMMRGEGYEEVGEKLGRKGVEGGVREVEMKLKGVGPVRVVKGVRRGLEKGGLRVVRVGQERQVGHNGCRGRKRRRL
uniref:Ribosomal protein S11 n=1 Tax=Labyrinthula sp. TaxID=1678526 RepID=A0A7S6ZP72_9STRA|nr:ribosomal protein S11 [Labyrinthula sp.]